MDITITQFDISQDCEIYKVCLTGTLSQKTIGKFQKTFVNYLPQKNILIDFSQATIKNDGTICVITETILQIKMALIGKAVAPFGLKDQDAQHMQRLGIEEENFLPIFPTEDEAIFYLSANQDYSDEDESVFSLDQGKVQWILPQGDPVRGKLALLTENKTSYILFSNPAEILSEITDRYVQIPTLSIENVAKKGFFIWQTLTIHVKSSPTPFVDTRFRGMCTGITEYIFKGNLGRMGEIIEYEVKQGQFTNL